MHWFDIQDYGESPVYVEEGKQIEIGFRSKEGGQRFCYIYSGYEYNYNEVEGQEYDFTVHYSSWNGNSTDSDWGFIPFILYQPA